MIMKRLLIVLATILPMSVFGQSFYSTREEPLRGIDTGVEAQEYYPEGTKWTEIRLDTLKYDSWYSKVGDEWVPNFETIEYYVKGEYIDKRMDDFNTFKKVYTNGPEWSDSLTLLIQEGEQAGYRGHDCVLVSVLDDTVVGEEPFALFPGEAYQFDWSIGKRLYYEDILESNTTSLLIFRFHYGIIDEIKEGYFGGVRPLKYVDLDGKAPDDKGNIKNIATNGGRIIQGIGITEWNDGECLFGPPDPYFALTWNRGYRHYRSMLVHFERDGEVLYDVWPEKGAINVMMDSPTYSLADDSPLFDLQGRQATGAPRKGIYIKNGRKSLYR